MKILVTGGNGFVGRELCGQLPRNAEVRVADMLRYQGWRFDDDERRRFDLVRLDIRDRDAVAAMFASSAPDAIVHLAAVHFIPECEQHPGLAISTNVQGTVNLLSLAPRGCRFVFASSGAVYLPADGPHHEDSAVRATDVYGLTKLQGEQWVRHFASERGLDSVILRLFNVIGPGETNPHVLPEILKQIQTGAETLRLGNTAPQRDFVHVVDAARGFIAAATSPATNGGSVQIANIAGGRQYSVAEMVTELGAISGRALRVEQDDSRMRAVDRPMLLADIRRAKQLFDWAPQKTFRTALEDAWNQPDPN